MIARRSPPGAVHRHYVLDKVLHDELLNPSKVMPKLRGRTRVILLVRGPREALSSIIRTLDYSEALALEHYLSRLASITQGAELMSAWADEERAVAVTHDQVLHRTEEAFHLLEDYLGLTRPLQQTYEVLPTTGKLRIGDPSPNIRAGVILREEKPKGHPVVLSPTTLARAEEAYNLCLATLSRCCRMLPSDIGPC
jgi:hypothetical protein